MAPVQEQEIQITRSMIATQSEILTEDAARFLARLAGRFEGTRQRLLAMRSLRQREIDAGKLPDFLADTAPVRAAEWTVAPIPRDLLDRRRESEATTAEDTERIGVVRGGLDVHGRRDPFPQQPGAIVKLVGIPVAARKANPCSHTQPVANLKVPRRPGCDPYDRIGRPERAARFAGPLDAQEQMLVVGLPDNPLGCEEQVTLNNND